MTWPNSLKLVDEYRTYPDPTDHQKILCSNVRELYRL
jgi:hypothetical protein